MRQVYCWEFNYYDKNEDEWLDCTYYTFSDSRQTAVEAFQADDPGNDQWSCSLDEIISEVKMSEIYGMEMVVDR
mgnify:FL=1